MGWVPPVSGSAQLKRIGFFTPQPPPGRRRWSPKARVRSVPSPSATKSTARGRVPRRLFSTFSTGVSTVVFPFSTLSIVREEANKAPLSPPDRLAFVEARCPSRGRYACGGRRRLGGFQDGSAAEPPVACGSGAFSQATLLSRFSRSFCRVSGFAILCVSGKISCDKVRHRPLPWRNPMSDDTLVGKSRLSEAKLAEAKSSITRRFVGQERVVDLVLSAISAAATACSSVFPGSARPGSWARFRPCWGSTRRGCSSPPTSCRRTFWARKCSETGADGSRTFKFIEGPVFCQLLMADDHQPAPRPARSPHSCRRCRKSPSPIAGQPHDLPKPFHGARHPEPDRSREGTYPLPEAQLDRFLVQIDVPYPDRDTERDILLATTGPLSKTKPTLRSTPVFTADELMAAQKRSCGGCRWARPSSRTILTSSKLYTAPAGR